MKPIAMIAAECKSRGIGCGNKLPWRLKQDMAFFTHVTTRVDLTTNDLRKTIGKLLTPTVDSMNAIVMGRKTWESVPAKYQPMPGRLNVILTRSQEHAERFYFKSSLYCHSLELTLPWMPCIRIRLAAGENSTILVLPSIQVAVEQLQRMPQVRTIYITGGAEIYRQALSLSSCTQVFLTHIDQDFECDTFFPDLTTAGFVKQDSSVLREQLDNPIMDVTVREGQYTYEYQLYTRV